MSAYDDLLAAAVALEIEPYERFRRDYAGTAPLLAQLLRRAAFNAIGLHDGQVEHVLRLELAVARSVLGRMADPSPQPADPQEPAMPMPGRNHLTARELQDALWALLGGDSDTPVVAVTPHGSFTFAVGYVTRDADRVTLTLREVERATDRSA